MRESLGPRITKGFLQYNLASRLAKYLRTAQQLTDSGREIVSSEELGRYSRINPVQVRRDLAAIGFRGTRGVGYVADDLIEAARNFLDLRPVYHIALVGAGRLGSALAQSDILAKRGFVIRDVFDTDPHKVGRTIGDIVIQHVDELEGRVAEAGEIIGIIATPPNAAQEIADRMVRAGIRIILNYTEVLLRVPEWVDVPRVDPVGQLMYTLYYLTYVEGQQDPYRS